MEDGDSEMLSGDIRISGSSTVYPVAQEVSRQFQQNHSEVSFNLTRDGSSGGFENVFIPTDSDINNASRPIAEEEVQRCRDNGFEPVEFFIAQDALTAVVNNNNDWVDSMSVETLREIWSPDTAPEMWSDVNSDWPDEFDLYGAATTPGTFDYFTEAVMGEEDKIREDFEGTEEGDLIAQGVSGNEYALGYLPFAYYTNNRVKALSLTEGDGNPVAPSLDDSPSAGSRGSERHTRRAGDHDCGPPPILYRDMWFTSPTRGAFVPRPPNRRMVKNVASVVAELEPEDFYLLSGVEQGMRFSEWVNREKLPDYANLTAEEVDYRLDRCMKRDLIQRRTIQYEGYQLTFEGYDTLALHTFAERDTVEGVGAPLGVGKESDVYEVRSYRPLALKFHREGYTNFREVNKEREYTADHHHVSWLYTARKAAEREHDALETLYPDVSVPRPVDHNRHAILMTKFEGVELARTKLDDRQAVGVLDLILDEVTDAYAAGMVHADLSEHNVAVAESGVTIFDWPQAVSTDHANAVDLLDRDVSNLIGFFQRKYPAVVPDVDASAVAEAVASGDFETVREFATSRSS